jgi:hypothetical protein
MGSTVTAAVIGILVPIGECGPKSLESKESPCTELGERHYKGRELGILNSPLTSSGLEAVLQFPMPGLVSWAGTQVFSGPYHRPAIQVHSSPISHSHLVLPPWENQLNVSWGTRLVFFLLTTLPSS